jgi:aminoglycoside phosphotransferase (APT) family kinase protein
MMGGQNCHAEIKFEDGVVWLARLRLSSVMSPPPEVRDYVLQSEATTMQFLQDTRIPSPRVFDWACESDPTNTIGVGYILMEKMHGTPLEWQSATATQKEKIVRQLADIMLEMERHPFDQLGSLIATAGMWSGEAAPGTAVQSQIQVDGLAEHSTFRSGDGGRPLGPFRSSQEAFRALVEAHLRMIMAGEIGTAENALDIFLAHRFRLDVLDRVSEQTATTTKDGEQFFLKHADDKGDHILVNADFEIVGIIDWEWCGTASKEEAFSSPCMMWPVAAFYDSSNKLAEEELLLARVFRERGREDLAYCVLNGRKVQRLLFALGPGGAHEDRKTLASLFIGLKRAFDRHGLKADEQGVEDEWRVWKAKALEDWKHEALLKVVVEANDQLAAHPS